MDLDADGIPDLISGSWPGELYLFKGLGDGEYAAPERIMGKDGRPINVGGGVHETNGDDMFLIAANPDDVQQEEVDGKLVITYFDERFEIDKGGSLGITGTASAVHATDWNDDGLIDLLVGEIGGTVSVIFNEGTPEQYAFGKEQPLQAGGEPIRVDGGDAGPFVADWDGDGLPDLLVGTGNGSVILFRNVGSADGPELAEGTILVPPGTTYYGDEAPKEPTRGTRAKVCVTDWDGDGLIDLLVGDFNIQATELPEPSPEEQARHDELRAEQVTLMERYQELIDRLHGESRETDPDRRKSVDEEFQSTLNRMNEVSSELPSDTEYHGWVWFFRRQPVDAVGDESD